MSIRSEEEMAELIDYAPEFKLESIEGGQVALSDLKGKYVYIDIWATWCGPCLRQIPAMKELEEKYRGKNIEIMSVSVDSEKDKDKWRKMIEVREMKGIQLFAGRTSVFIEIIKSKPYLNLFWWVKMVKSSMKILQDLWIIEPVN